MILDTLSVYISLHFWVGLTWVHLGEEPDGVGVRGATKLMLLSWLFWFMNSHQPGKGAAVFCVVLCSSLGLESRSWVVLGFICILRCQRFWMVCLFVATFDCRNLHLSFWRETFSRQPGLRRSLLSLSELYIVNQAKVVKWFSPTWGFLWIGNNTIKVASFWWIEGPFDHVREAAVWFLGDPVMVCFPKVDPDCNVTLFCIACRASICLSCRSRNICIFS